MTWLDLKIILADLGWRKLTPADVWEIRKEIQRLYKESAQINPMASEESEKELGLIDWNIRYLKKVLFSYQGEIKEPAPASQTSADSR
jgi:hypothetical protein